MHKYFKPSEMTPDWVKHLWEDPVDIPEGQEETPEEVGQKTAEIPHIKKVRFRKVIEKERRRKTKLDKKIIGALEKLDTAQKNYRDTHRTGRKLIDFSEQALTPEQYKEFIDLMCYPDFEVITELEEQVARLKALNCEILESDYIKWYFDQLKIHANILRDRILVICSNTVRTESFERSMRINANEKPEDLPYAIHTLIGYIEEAAEDRHH